MITNSLELPLIIGLLMAAFIFQATILLVYIQVRTLVKKYDRTSKDLFEKHLSELIEKHLSDYLGDILPERNQLAHTLAKTIKDHDERLHQDLESTLKEEHAKLVSSASQTVGAQVTDLGKQLTGLNTQLQDKLTQSFESALASVSTTHQTVVAQVSDELNQYKAKRVEQIDRQVSELVQQILGDIVADSLTVTQHTQIIKDELTKAREYYET